MSLRDYIGTKALSLCMAGIAGLYLILVLCFCGIPRSLLLILLLSGVLVAAVCTAVGWRRTDRRLRMLKSRLDALPEKYLIGETLDRPRDALELEYYLLMQETARRCVDGKPVTNADRIRSMNDEELKKFICSMLKCEFCDFELGERCGLLIWLQQPAEVSE